MKTTLRCPMCRKTTEWQDNPSRPFCSERCRLLDLGQWANEDYSIVGAVAPKDEDNSEF